MSLLAAYRLAVGAAVQEATGIKVKAGFFNGPVRNGDLGCCWSVSVAEDDNIVRQTMEARVRLYKRFDRQPDPEVPLDPSPLEDLIEVCQVTISQGPLDLGVAGVWFARLTEAEINMEQNGVEMQWIAWAWNHYDQLGFETP